MKYVFQIIDTFMGASTVTGKGFGVAIPGNKTPALIELIQEFAPSTPTPSLSTVLGIGNTTGANDLIISSGQRLDSTAALNIGTADATSINIGSGTIPIAIVGNVTLTGNLVISSSNRIDSSAALNIGTVGATGINIGSGPTIPIAIAGDVAVNGNKILTIDAATGEVWINQSGALHGSGSGIQYSSLVSSRSQIRVNQYGNNAGVPGISTFKSRATSIGGLAPVQVGDVIYGVTAVGVTDNLSVPLSGLIRILVAAVPAASGWIATDYEVQLVPLAGPANGRKQAFRITSEGIFHIKEAANCMAGVATLDGTGTVVVANTQVTATTKFSLTFQDGGSIPTGSVYQSSRVIGTSFTIKSTAGAADSGVKVYYQLWEATAP